MTSPVGQWPQRLRRSPGSNQPCGKRVLCSHWTPPCRHMRRKENFSSFQTLETEASYAPSFLADIGNWLASSGGAFSNTPCLTVQKLKKFFSIVIITHNSKNKSLYKIVKQIENKNYIIKKPKLIRIATY